MSEAQDAVAAVMSELADELPSMRPAELYLLSARIVRAVRSFERGPFPPAPGEGVVPARIGVEPPLHPWAVERAARSPEEKRDLLMGSYSAGGVHPLAEHFAAAEKYEEHMKAYSAGHPLAEQVTAAREAVQEELREGLSVPDAVGDELKSVSVAEWLAENGEPESQADLAGGVAAAPRPPLDRRTRGGRSGPSERDLVDIQLIGWPRDVAVAPGVPSEQDRVLAERLLESRGVWFEVDVRGWSLHRRSRSVRKLNGGAVAFPAGRFEGSRRGDRVFGRALPAHPALEQELVDAPTVVAMESNESGGLRVLSDFVADRLRMEPGVWFELVWPSAGAARFTGQGLAQKIRSGMSREFRPTGSFQARNRAGDRVFARFVGANAAE